MHLPAAAERRAVMAQAARAQGGEDPIRLRDGSAVVIRPIGAGDDARLAQGKGFSERSVYLRFLGPPPKPTRATLTYLTEVDHHDHEALVAMTPDDGELLGVARFVRLAAEPHVAEAAIIVVDDWQRRGLGRMLLERLAQRAREEGILCFAADLLPENDAVLSLMRDLGETHVDRSVPSVTGVRIELGDEDGLGPMLRRALRAAASGEVSLFGRDWRGMLAEIRAAWDAIRP